MNYTLTNHAQTRFAQRNLKPEDLELILIHGTETGDGVLLTRKDALREIEHLKGTMKRFKRLADTYVVADCGTIITSYRPGRRTMKRVSRSIETQNRGDAQ